MLYTQLSMNDKQLGSFRTRTESSSIVIAEWNIQLLGLANLKMKCQQILFVEQQESVDI